MDPDVAMVEAKGQSRYLLCILLDDVLLLYIGTGNLKLYTHHFCLFGLFA